MKNEWQIADFRLSPELNQLAGPAGEIHLEPRTTAVLLDLAEHAGEVRTREELLTAVWRDAFVGEAALTHCIWELRKAFGDDARNPRFIKTVPRRGYRLIAEVGRAGERRLGTLLRTTASPTAVLPQGAAPDLDLSTPSGSLWLFDRPSEALRAALAIQSSDEADAKAVIHMDEVVLEAPASDDQPSGLDGRLAERLNALLNAARAGQILLTSSAFDMARRSDDGSQAASLSWSALGPFTLDDTEEPVELFEVAPEGRILLGAPPPSDRLNRLDGDSTILGWRPGPGIIVPRRPNWILKHKLGEGSFGEVWLSEHVKTHDRRVFKFCFEVERLRALQREVTLVRLLKESLGERDDIIHLLDWNFDQAPYFLEMEHTSAGSLEAWAADRGG